MTTEPYRRLPYSDPTGDTAAARVDRDPIAPPRKDGRTFRKVVNGIQEIRC